MLITDYIKYIYKLQKYNDKLVYLTYNIYEKKLKLLLIF